MPEKQCSRYIFREAHTATLVVVGHGQDAVKVLACHTPEAARSIDVLQLGFGDRAGVRGVDHEEHLFVPVFLEQGQGVLSQPYHD